MFKKYILSAGGGRANGKLFVGTMEELFVGVYHIKLPLHGRIIYLPSANVFSRWIIICHFSGKAKLPKLLQLTMRRKKGVRESKNDAKFQRFEAPSKPKFDPGEDFQDRVRKSLRNRNCAGKTLSNKLEALTANSTKRPLRLCRTRQRTTSSTRRNFVRLKV